MLMQAEMRVQSGAIVRDHMQKELIGTEEKMRLLQQEIALIKIQVHVLTASDAAVADALQICSQDEKVADATRSINDLQQRRSLVESSLQVHSLVNALRIPLLSDTIGWQSVETEASRAALLLQALAPGIR